MSLARLSRTVLALGVAAALAAAPAGAFPLMDASPDVPPAPVGATSFMWGVTMSDYQNDGAHPAMDWAELERSGHLPERSGRSADFRGHMEGDLDRAASLGLNAFRTSIEWSRIEPVEGHIDAREVAHLHRFFAALKRRGMTPVVALHHFATPSWAMKADAEGLQGWESPRIVERYRRYVAFVAKEFGAELDWYITFNEPATMILGAYTLGWTLPRRIGPVSTVRAMANVVTAHVAAYEELHRADRVARVSIAEYNALFPVADGGFHYMPSQLLALLLDKARGWDGRPRVRYLDYLALHYYGAVDAAAAASFPVQPWRWGVRPDQLGHILKAYHKAFNLPILLAENGFATRDGEPRSDGWTREAYMVAHIDALMRLKREGLPILGYMYWTLTDNYEWGSFAPRFGLWRVEIRRGDLTRRATPAVAVYREIIRHGGVTPALRQAHPPPAPLAAGR
jgi:beta-glucosidase